MSRFAVNGFPILVLAFFLLLPAESVAQRKIYEEDVVYLHNGSVLRGTILEQVPRQSLTIQVYDGTIFHLPTADIDRVVREPSQYIQIQLKYDNKVVPLTYIDEPGWFKGYGVAVSANSLNGNLHILMRSGYRWDRWRQVSLVSGLEPYQAGLVIPVAAEWRADLFARPVTPHVFVQGGYGLAANRSPRHRIFRGGPMYQIGTGLTFRTRTQVEHHLSLGYKWLNTYQEFEEDPPWFWTPDQQVRPDPVVVTGNRNYRRIVVGFSTHF